MKYSILFMPDNRAHLRMVVRYMGKRLFCNVGYNIDTDKWNKDTQRCRRNTTHGKDLVPAAKINAAIQHYEDTAVRVLDTQPATFDDFKQQMLQAIGRHHEQDNEPHKDFFSLYEQYLSSESNRCSWSKGTVQKTQRLIKEWQDFRPDMTLTAINENTLEQFRQYQTSLNHQNETVLKKLSMSKWFFRWLVSKGLLTDLSFSAYRPRLKRSSRCVVYLTWTELMAVYNHQFTTEEQHLARVRDVFCFCCFTSLRYSDARALKKADIYGDALHITTQKTNDRLTIELNDYSRAILQSYTAQPGERALPVISNQKMNDYLKEVGRLCGLNEKLTDVTYTGGIKTTITKPKWQMLGTHCGRRTFICNALMMGIPANTVMKWTGHSDYNSMKPYIDIADSAKKTAMALFNRTKP